MSISIIVTVTPRDLRWARICLASVRRFHPDIPVRVLPGAPLPRSFLKEVSQHFDVGVFPVAPGEYGWGFVKLEPLFQAEPGHRFLILDADTILLGPVAHLFHEANVQFLVDDETQPEAEIRRLYYDWEKVRLVDPQAHPPRFVFNSGQWFGTSGVLTRDDFATWIDWTIPRKLRHPQIFMPGDQGILNYALNQRHQLAGLAVERRKIMRWPGHGLDDIDADELEKSPCPLIIHWAGFKAARLETLPRADLLLHNERFYYERIPGGERLRLARAQATALAYHTRILRTKIAQRFAGRSNTNV